MNNYNINPNNNSIQESRPKKNKKGIIIAIVAIVCVIGVFSGSNETASTDENVDTETQEVTPEVITDTNVTDISSDEETDKTFNGEEEFIEFLKHDVVPHNLPQGDECTGITISDKQIIINVSLNNDVLAYVSNTFSTITDSILDIEEGYEYWESITVDCGDYGSITKTKNDIVDNEYGMPYFNLTDEKWFK